MPKNKTSAAEAAAAIKPRAEITDDCRVYVPSGSTVLNCALCDDPFGGFALGKIVNIVGESSAGKTMIAETLLAECANDPRFDDYALILDDSEHAMEMDISGLFGAKAAERIKAPRYDSEGLPVHSDTVEDWCATMTTLNAAGKPFIYCLDSLDTLTDESEYDQAAEYVKAANGEKNSAGATYGTRKARLMSQALRTMKAGIAKNNSLLVVISQVRDNINARPGQSTKKRSGGKALDFYCTHIIWLTALKTLKQGKVNRQEVIGRLVETKVTKNKLTGKVRAVEFPIYYDYGVDDIGSCIDFLCDYDVISRKGSFLEAEILGISGNVRKSDLISQIEEKDSLLQHLRTLVGEIWNAKEEELRLGRRPRFGGE